jgi:hypothetical protein
VAHKDGAYGAAEQEKQDFGPRAGETTQEYLEREVRAGCRWRTAHGAL